MAYVKYLLGKTGLFPKYRPQVYDVLKAAFRACEIRKTVNSRGKKYYCIMPTTCDFKELYEMVILFRENGVFIKPKRTKENNRNQSMVFWVRDRGQQFMHDVFRVNQDAGNFQDVVQRYNKQTTLQKLFGKFENEK